MTTYRIDRVDTVTGNRTTLRQGLTWEQAKAHVTDPANHDYEAGWYDGWVRMPEGRPSPLTVKGDTNMERNPAIHGPERRLRDLDRRSPAQAFRYLDDPGQGRRESVRRHLDRHAMLGQSVDEFQSRRGSDGSRQ